MTKLFKVGGVSKSKSGYKVRFATYLIRAKILNKTDSDVNLIELPSAMEKGAAVAYLKTTELYAKFSEAIDSANEKYNGGKSVKVTVTKVAKPAKKTVSADQLLADVGLGKKTVA
jgi:hypothetical protein